MAMAVTSCTLTYPGIATGNTAEKTGVAEKTVWFGIALKPVDVSISKAALKGGAHLMQLLITRFREVFSRELTEQL